MGVSEWVVYECVCVCEREREDNGVVSECVSV
jgi:hypothetical protein